MSTNACATCPYRRSTPIGIWDDSEYEKLRAEDSAELGGAIFNCHKKDGSLCRGWLIDQKRRGLPSLVLRILLGRDKTARTMLRAVDESSPDLYDSIDEMIVANRGAVFPVESPKARALAKKKGVL